MANILILTQQDSIPSTLTRVGAERPVSVVTECDVRDGLIALGHRVHFQGFSDTLHQVHRRINALAPDVVFNLVEHFRGDVTLDHCAASLLELEGVPYTGSNARGLMLARDKSLAKKILSYHNLPTPAFQVFPRNKQVRLNKKLTFPLIVKSLCDDGSMGISQDSLIHSESRLKDRISYIHDHLGSDALVEEFIAGQELSVGILGMQRLRALPVWQVFFDNAKNANTEIYTHFAKWRADYRKRKGIHADRAEIHKDKALEVQGLARKACRVLGVNGYARVDFRVSATGQVYILEVNPNPDLARDDELAASAADAGLDYEDLLITILRQAHQRSTATLSLAG
jgi:D-alanine-D-alanine ligase